MLKLLGAQTALIQLIVVGSFAGAIFSGAYLWAYNNGYEDAEKGYTKKAIKLGKKNQKVITDIGKIKDGNTPKLKDVDDKINTTDQKDTTDYGKIMGRLEALNAQYAASLRNRNCESTDLDPSLRDAINEFDSLIRDAGN